MAYYSRAYHRPSKRASAMIRSFAKFVLSAEKRRKRKRRRNSNPFPYSGYAPRLKYPSRSGYRW